MIFRIAVFAWFALLGCALIAVIVLNVGWAAHHAPLRHPTPLPATTWHPGWTTPSPQP